MQISSKQSAKRLKRQAREAKERAAKSKRDRELSAFVKSQGFVNRDVDNELREKARERLVKAAPKYRLLKVQPLQPKEQLNPEEPFTIGFRP